MGVLDTLRDVLFTYSSVRYVQVEAKCPAIVFRTLQLVVLVYVVVFSVVIEEAYQQYEPVVAETFSKLKGAAMVNGTVVDVNDLVIPAMMENAIFITTNLVQNTETMNSTCPLSGVKGYACTHDNECQRDSEPAFVPNQNYGILTGVCMPEGWCQVRGWCTNVSNGTGSLPLDPNATQTGNLVQGVEQWSLFLRLNYAFPAFGVTLNSAESKLTNGRNQWQVSQILDQIGVSYADIAYTGAIILMNAKFDCNFNHGTDNCDPDWEFSRLDKTKDSQTFSTGFNFYEKMVNPLLPNKRTVVKRYGLKFEFNVSGQAGKFSLVSLLIALGSGLALLSIASLVTDFMLSNFWSKKEHYKKVRNCELDEELLQTDINTLDGHSDKLLNSLRE